MERRCLFLLAAIISSVAAVNQPAILDRAADAVVSAEKATCDTGLLPSCLVTYFEHYGFGDEVPSEAVFDGVLHRYVILYGSNGWSQVRNWTNDLYDCLGGLDNFNLCVGWQQLMTTFNLTKNESLDWEVRWRTLAYNVGPAFNVLTLHWYCINQVDLYEDAYFNACQANFDNQQHNNPNQTCQHVAEYLVCVQRPYAQYCGREVGAFACHFERIVFQVLYPHCADHVALHCQGAPTAPPQTVQPK